MLLLVINFIKVILINMHLQSICENIVNCVDIQYKNSKNKKKLIIKSSILFNKVLNYWKNKAVCVIRQIVTTPQKQKETRMLYSIKLNYIHNQWTLNKCRILKNQQKIPGISNKVNSNIIQVNRKNWLLTTSPDYMIFWWTNDRYEV